MSTPVDDDDDDVDDDDDDDDDDDNARRPCLGNATGMPVRACARILRKLLVTLNIFYAGAQVQSKMTLKRFSWKGE